MKVIDSFLFFNEFDVLRMRTEYLKDVVDYFLICECKYTFSGKEKPYYLDDIIDELDEEEVEKAIQSEVKAFMKWANKGKRARLFEFKSLDPIVGEALNRCAFDGDLETARALAKAYLT